MTARIRAFFTGASKAYDIYGSLSQDNRVITVESGFLNVGKAMKKSIKQDGKSSSKPKKSKEKHWNLMLLCI